MNSNLAISNELSMFKSSTLNHPFMRPVARDDPFRQSLEKFIFRSYKKTFDAQVNSYLPNLVMSIRSDDEIHAAFGYNDANQGQLFLENYIDLPIEAQIGNRLGRKIDRNAIVEVGNLAITEKTDSVRFLRDIARYLQGLGYEWIVCTATRYLRLLFLRSGSKPFSLAPASIARVQEEGTHWGSYYATQPEILVGNVNQSVDLIEQKLSQAKSKTNQKTHCLKLTD